MPVLVAAAVSAVNALLLLLLRWDVLPLSLAWVASVLSLAGVAVMCVVCLLLRHRHRYFLVAAVLDAGYLLLLGVSYLLALVGRDDGSVAVYATMAAAVAFGTVFFLLALSDVLQAPRLSLVLVVLAGCIGLLGLWQSLVGFAFLYDSVGGLLLDPVFAVGDAVGWLHLLVQVATALALGLAFVRERAVGEPAG